VNQAELRVVSLFRVRKIDLGLRDASSVPVGVGYRLEVGGQPRHQLPRSLPSIWKLPDSTRQARAIELLVGRSAQDVDLLVGVPVRAPSRRAASTGTEIGYDDLVASPSRAI